MYAEDSRQIIKQLEAELKAKDAEVAALKEEIGQIVASNQAQVEELQDLRVLAQAVRKHFNNNLGVERCVACSKCDYEELEKAMLQCKAFTRIRL
ncbi:MAG: hypothetical protein GXY49_09390 [Syntrophomonadaceae bacterium]|nr:hypothetical protein [Syntrophomonadaceae bacterium]